MSRPKPDAYWNRRDRPPSSAESRMAHHEHEIEAISLRDDYPGAGGTSDKPCWVLCRCGVRYDAFDSNSLETAYARHTERASKHGQAR